MNTNQNQVSDTSGIDEIRAELARLRAENEALKNRPVRSQGGLSVTPKGAIRIPGIGMFGLILYQEQYVNLFKFLEIPMPEKLVKFIDENKSKLAVKPEGHVSRFAEEFKKRAEAKKLGKVA